MAFSTTVTITDTGKRSTSSGSAEETDKANSGTAITLYGVEFTSEEGAILNTAPVLGKLSGASGTMYVPGEVDHLGIQTPKITLRGVLSLSVSNDVNTIVKLRHLVRTKGYKLLAGDIPNALYGGSGLCPVRIERVSFSQSANSNLINYTITMFETA